MVLKVLRLLPELDFGGVESRVQLQGQLHAPSDYALRVCAFHKLGKAARRLEELGVPVDVLNVDPRARNPAATLALARYLRRQRPDVLHASIAEANFHGLLAGSASRVPVRIAEETGMPAHSRTARLMYRGVYQLASSVVGVTSAVADYVRDVDRAPRDRVRVIHNCAGPAFFPEARATVARPPGPFRVLLVGRLVPVKNHLHFLAAVAPLLSSRPDLRVAIAGDGPLRTELARAIRELGLEGSVELLGARSEVQQLLATAHLFALPSLSEGCSVSLIEAMASGVPAIGSDVPGVREVMGPLAAEWTTSSTATDGWIRLLTAASGMEPAKREAWALRAQARMYELFSPTTYVARLSSLYRELSGAMRSRPTTRAEQAVT